LMPSVRIGAEQLSKQDGVSLNQFINVAVAEKVAQMENQAWIERRKPLTGGDRERMMALLEQGGTLPPEPGDEVPGEYKTWAPSRERKVRGKAS
jgi:hypothetical protein